MATYLNLKGKQKIMSEKVMNEELNEQVAENQEEIKQELTEVEALKEEIKKEKDQYLRLFAEFDNYKKRTAKERLDFFKTANIETITALLPVLDDFERAMKEMTKSGESEHLQGIQLIQSKLTETLRVKGLNQLEINVGDEFDTDKMEAITLIPAPSEDLKGKVIDVVETGYALTDKVIRYAKVVVGQ